MTQGADIAREMVPFLSYVFQALTVGETFFFFFYQGKKTTTNKQTNKKKTLFAFENCQNSFSGVPLSVHSGLPNT